jgi:hypothetical protein
MGGTIGLWEGDLEAPLPSVLVLRKSEYEELSESLLLAPRDQPKALRYRGETSSYLPSIEMYVVKYTEFPKYEVICKDLKLSEFFSAWEAFCQSPRDQMKAVRAKESALALSESNSGGVKESACELIEEITEEVVNSLFGSRTVFGKFTGREDPLWWRRTPARSAAILRVFDRWSTLGANSSDIQDHLEQGIRALYSSRVQDSLLAASAYCLASAEHERDHGSLMSAVCCVHRAIDYFLQSRCADEGLLIETPAGLRLTASTNIDGKPGVMACYLALTTAGSLLAQEPVDKALTFCNNVRNNLLLTHSVFGVDDGHWKKFYTLAHLACERINEGTWLSICKKAKALLLSSGLDPRMLFGGIAGLRAQLPAGDIA